MEFNNTITEMKISTEGVQQQTRASRRKNQQLEDRSFEISQSGGQKTESEECFHGIQKMINIHDIMQVPEEEYRQQTKNQQNSNIKSTYFLLLISLNVNKLNSSVKRHKVAEWIKRKQKIKQKKPKIQLCTDYKRLTSFMDMHRLGG